MPVADVRAAASGLCGIAARGPLGLRAVVVADTGETAILIDALGDPVAARAPIGLIVRKAGSIAIAGVGRRALGPVGIAARCSRRGDGVETASRPRIACVLGAIVPVIARSASAFADIARSVVVRICLGRVEIQGTVVQVVRDAVPVRVGASGPRRPRAPGGVGPEASLTKTVHLRDEIVEKLPPRGERLVVCGGNVESDREAILVV
jgi:hypothetical protein